MMISARNNTNAFLMDRISRTERMDGYEQEAFREQQETIEALVWLVVCGVLWIAVLVVGVLL